MKKLIIFFIVITCISCSKINSQNVKSIKKTPPIFLSLSPEMSDEIFENEINRMNVNGDLSHGHFIFPTEKKDYRFKIYKGDDFIKLTYRDVFLYKNIGRDKENQAERMHNGLEISSQDKNTIYSIYRKKYMENLTIKIPFMKRITEGDRYLLMERFDINEITFVRGDSYPDKSDISSLNYYFGYDSYRVFFDEKKTILIGYDLIKRDAFATDLWNFYKPANIGVEISIYYFSKIRFRSVIAELNKTLSEFKIKELERIKNYNLKKDKLNNNLKKF